MTERTLIVVVDDDPHIAEIIEFSLSAAGYEVKVASNGQGALEAFHQYKPALLVLDINLPDRDGWWVCQQIRQESQVPILFLSARDEEVDRVMGLTIGGDDYVTKPFSMRELTARVQAILRRGTPTTTPAQKSGAVGESWQMGLLRLDLEGRGAYWDGRKADLTATEFDILKTLLARPNKVFTRDELLDMVYRDTVVSDRTIDSHILHIRKKFSALGAEEVISTQHGVGYKLGSGR